MSWKLIDTAPKDGTLIQTAEYYGGEWNMRNLNWVEAQGECEAGWACPDQGYTGFNYPTHWMSLPAEPPQDQSK